MSDLSMTDADQEKLEAAIRAEVAASAALKAAVAEQQRLIDLYKFGEYSNKGGSRRRSRGRRSRRSRRIVRKSRRIRK